MIYHKFAKATSVFLLILLSIVEVNAQQTHIYTDPSAEFQEAMDLFRKEKYAAAREAFESFIVKDKDKSHEAKIDALYLRAVCAFELFHADAEFLLLEFVNKYPESSRAKEAAFQLGKLYYKKKSWKNAVDWFEKVDAWYLTEQEVVEHKFKLGYAYYNRNEFEKASEKFLEVKNGNSKYAIPALYYYSHIAYINKNYETALKGFMSLKDDPAFGPVVPQYIVQIYYFQGRYDDVISYGTNLLPQAGPKDRIEITRLIGESYYKTARYAESIPFLQDYQDNNSSPTREDYYQLAYAYYRTSNWAKAIVNFEKSVDGTDELAQNAYYHLADCFIKMSNKQSARNAFQFASKLEHNKAIQEDALFNYAKLSVELNFQPVAISTLQEYMKSFPNSGRMDEINELLAQVFLTTKNYKDALSAIESIKTKTPRVRTALQKCAYYRALELFNDGDLKNAISNFDKAIANPSDEKLAALARYWKGESLYRQNSFDAALKNYQEFVFAPAAITTPFFNLVQYNIGYCYFKKEDYASAMTAFRKYVAKKEQTDKARFDDANMRVGDAFFMMREYDNAVDYYNNSIDSKSKAADYALYQKGIILGVQGRSEEKIKVMQNLISNYPKSSYLDDAIYETARTYSLIGEFDKSLQAYDKIINEYPSGSYYRKALVGKGLVQYNKKEDSKAIETYKSVISQFPNSSEAAEALSGMKVIYVNNGDAQGYLDYVKGIPSASISVAASDSLTYHAAENKYMKGDCAGSMTSFSDYLSKYPNGFFSINATFYKAECDYREKRFDQAITGYQFVVNKPRNNFTEKSLLKLAGITYSRKDYSNALKNYTELETVAEVRNNLVDARLGIVRCTYKLGEYTNVMNAVDKLINMEKVPNEILQEARLLGAKSLLETNDLIAALREFRSVAKIANSEMGAEAKYNIAYVQHKQTLHKESQASLFELINQVPAYDYWIAKGFILMGDNYVALADTFQAIHTYKSIIENYSGEDLKTIAQQKLDQISPPANSGTNREGKEENESTE